MIFDWNNEKNIMLKRDRNISFERIIIAIEQDSLLDILEHPNKEKYPNQLLLLVEIDRYVYVVPCVLENMLIIKEKKMNTEKELYESIENDEWEAVKNFYDLRNDLKKAAKTMLMKKEKIDVILAKQDINNLKAKAFEEGMEYEIFAGSVLHKYLTGRLVEG